MIAGCLALICGLLQASSFAPTEAWWLQILSLAGLLALAWPAAPVRAGWLGGCFGLGWFAGGLWWLFISLHEFGGLAAPLAVLAVLLLATFLALYPAAALAGWAALRSAPAPARVALLGCTWLAAELARAQLFTGFPWIAGGYAHSVGPLAAWAPWLGVYGMGWLAALLAAALAAAWRAGCLPPLAGLGALVLAGYLLPQQFTQSAGSLPVTLVQPAVPQSQKFDPAHIDRHLDALLGQIEAARTPLVIAPESVITLPMAHLRPEQQERLLRASSDRTVWFGTFLGSDEGGWVNSMLALHQGRSVHEYGKRHLLPFGEFIPPGFDAFMRLLNIPIGSQSPGQHQRPLLLDGLRLRALICYEDLFGEDFVASAVAGEDAADVFVNTSNLGWFGTRMVLDQHLQFSQVRALEFQRPFVRATNTGATAHVDHRGQVLARLPAGERDQLVVEVEGRKGTTPYARWLHAAGLRPLWALALLPLLLGWAWSRKAARQHA
ncbi:MAG: apolipoprotein N-acyltransferase [Burkholderiales bacterium]|uniref:apolipoprotein N-acyltransferase n=1 Tax=Inhella sp. TaxID=1921806 RepID=UPI001AC980EC|nr:apolipoprotein N-acyltransferase [Burkholderiales bacterium]